MLPLRSMALYLLVSRIPTRGRSDWQFTEQPFSSSITYRLWSSLSLACISQRYFLRAITVRLYFWCFRPCLGCLALCFSTRYLLHSPMFIGRPYPVRGYIYFVHCSYFSFQFSCIKPTAVIHTSWPSGWTLVETKIRREEMERRKTRYPPARVYGFLFLFLGHCFFGSVGFLVTLCGLYQ